LELEAETEKEREGVGESNPFVLRLFAIFRRKPSRLMNAKEKEAFKNAGITDDALVAVERYYADRHPEWENNFRRRDLLTLLNNWNGEVDRAEEWMANPPKPRPQLSKMKNTV
jgi:hypothetical protein